MARLVRTIAIIADCKEVIGDIPESPVSAYLAQYCSVALCAEIEERIHELVELEVSPHSAKGRPFISAASKKILRSIKISEISGFLDKFGSPFKEHFQTAMNGQEANVSLYDKTVKFRHSTAHGPGADVTLGDVERVIPFVTHMLDSIEASFRNND